MLVRGARVSVVLWPPLGPPPRLAGGPGQGWDSEGRSRGSAGTGRDGLCAPRSRGRGGFVPHSVTEFEVLELELNEQ